MQRFPHVLIVEARFYQDLADELAKGAEQVLKGAETTFDRVSVPGAFEIPAVISMAMDSAGLDGGGRPYDGYIALGCVIRGETTHYDYICAESARALQELAVARHAAIGYGILTVENDEQAWARASVEQKNKGADAAKACLAMMNLRRRFGIR